tara:strand:- start:2182 stop:2529 length:348 start_codon:yes stop_codon:yes gene_type:complete
MNRIRIKKAKEALDSLAIAWYHDEEKHYWETYGDEAPEDIPTNLLEGHNYTDLRVLGEFFQELYLDQVQEQIIKDTLWTFVSDKDIPEIRKIIEEELANQLEELGEQDDYRKYWK